MEQEVENSSEGQLDEAVEEESLGEAQEENLYEKIEEAQERALSEDENARQVENSLESEIVESAGKLLENQVEKNAEESAEKIVERPIKKYKKTAIGIIIALCILLCIYLGMSVYFMNHFYYGSEINGIKISSKSVKDAEAVLTSELQKYTLTLKERGGKSEQIKAFDVGVRYPSETVFQNLKAKQNPFYWFLAYFNSKGYKMTTEITYDEKLLREQLNKLTCLASSNVIEPQNPKLQYKGNSYEILGEMLGNKIDKEILYASVADALLKKSTEMDLEAIRCYINPEYNSKSQKVIEAKNTLDKYLSSNVTYTFGNDNKTIDSNIINKWLTINKDYEVFLDEKSVGEYIETLFEKYNTAGGIKNFVTSSGKTIQLCGGDYVLPVDTAKETQELISAIKEGKTVVSKAKEEVGNTYVEIDLNKQHLWFYKEGALVTQGDVVTGNVRAGLSTPKGVYALKFKGRNVVLRGPGYAAPVAYWMPFNRGIGMHDAGWRSRFGGNIYKTDGSHGCINCPSNLVSAIYNSIEVGTPVVCY